MILNLGGTKLNINKYVGNKIREYRKKKGMNQSELGKLLGVAQNTVAGYEKGEFEVSYDNLFKLTEIFNISIDDLFPPTNSENNELHRALKLAGGNDLDLKDMELINKIIEKALELDDEERKKLFNSIEVLVKVFEKTDG